MTLEEVPPLIYQGTSLGHLRIKKVLANSPAALQVEQDTRIVRMNGKTVQTITEAMAILQGSDKTTLEVAKQQGCYTCWQKSHFEGDANCPGPLQPSVEQKQQQSQESMNTDAEAEEALAEVESSGLRSSENKPPEPEKANSPRSPSRNQWPVGKLVKIWMKPESKHKARWHPAKVTCSDTENVHLELDQIDYSAEKGDV
eukprot:gene4644-4221_t